MDTGTVVDVVIGLAASNPKTAAALALVPVVQTAAVLLSKVLTLIGSARKLGRPALPRVAAVADTIAALPVRLPVGAK